MWFLFQNLDNFANAGNSLIIVRGGDDSCASVSTASRFEKKDFSFQSKFLHFAQHTCFLFFIPKSLQNKFNDDNSQSAQNRSGDHTARSKPILFV